MKKCFKHISRVVNNIANRLEKREDLYNLHILFIFLYTYICVYIINQLVLFAAETTTQRHHLPILLSIGAMLLMVPTLYILKRYIFSFHPTKEEKERFFLYSDLAKCLVYTVLSAIIMEGTLFAENGTVNRTFESGYWLSMDFGILTIPVVCSMQTPIVKLCPVIFWIGYSYIRLQSWKVQVINSAFFVLKLCPVMFCLYMLRLFGEKIRVVKAQQAKSRKFASKVLDLLPEGVAIIDETGLKYNNQSLSTILRVKDSQCLEAIEALENMDFLEGLRNKAGPRRIVTLNDMNQRLVQHLNTLNQRDILLPRESIGNHKASSFNPDVKFNRSTKRNVTDKPFKINLEASAPIAFRKINIQQTETFEQNLPSEPTPFKQDFSLNTLGDRGRLLSPKKDQLRPTFGDIPMSPNRDNKPSEDFTILLDRKIDNRYEASQNHLKDKDYFAPDSPTTEAKTVKLRLKQIIDKIQQPYQKSEHSSAGEAIKELLGKLRGQFSSNESIQTKVFQSVKTLDQPKPIRKYMSRSATFQNERIHQGSKTIYYTLSHWAVIMNCQKEGPGDIKQRFEIKFTPFIAHGKPSLIILIRDITEREVIRQMEEKEKGQAQALAAVSHEFRTPLNGILGMLDTLKDQITKEISQNYLMPAYNSAKLLLTLVNDILDFHQMKENKLTLVPVKFSLRSKMEDCISLISIQAKRRGVRVEIDIDKRVPKYINNDPNRIQQVVNNLLGNALKFTLEGSIIVRVELHSNAKIMIKVLDTGIGIEPKNIEKLFKAFGKIDSDKNRELNPQGVGLGLIISSRIAELLCSDKRIAGLNVTSEYKKGSTFWFMIDDIRDLPELGETDENYGRSLLENIEDLNNRQFSPKNRPFHDPGALSKAFPSINERQTDHQIQNIKSSDDDSLKDALDEVVIEKQLTTEAQLLYNQESVLKSLVNTFKEQMKTAPYVLVVDDNDINHLVFQNFLKAFDIVIDSAYNGKQAIQKILQKKVKPKHEQYMLVFLDLEMPTMGGLECARELRKMIDQGQLSSFPMIAQSGHHDQEEVNRCHEAGMVDYLKKPVSRNTLVDVLIRWFRKEM